MTVFSVFFGTRADGCAMGAVWDACGAPMAHLGVFTLLIAHQSVAPKTASKNTQKQAKKP
jgi:hypothetical protein